MAFLGEFWLQNAMQCKPEACRLYKVKGIISKIDFWSILVSERLFTEIGEALFSNGYADVGYTRVNIDDCWMSKNRDPVTGRLDADPVRFPNGIKYLSDFVCFWS